MISLLAWISLYLSFVLVFYFSYNLFTSFTKSENHMNIEVALMWPALIAVYIYIIIDAAYKLTRHKVKREYHSNECSKEDYFDSCNCEED